MTFAVTKPMTYYYPAWKHYFSKDDGEQTCAICDLCRTKIGMSEALLGWDDTKGADLCLSCFCNLLQDTTFRPSFQQPTQPVRLTFIDRLSITDQAYTLNYGHPSYTTDIMTCLRCRTQLQVGSIALVDPTSTDTALCFNCVKVLSACLKPLPTI